MAANDNEAETAVVLKTTPLLKNHAHCITDPFCSGLAVQLISSCPNVRGNNLSAHRPVTSKMAQGVFSTCYDVSFMQMSCSLQFHVELALHRLIIYSAFHFPTLCFKLYATENNRKFPITQFVRTSLFNRVSSEEELYSRF